MLKCYNTWHFNIYAQEIDILGLFEPKYAEFLDIFILQPARGEIFSTVNGVPLHTAFHYHPPIVLILLNTIEKEVKSQVIHLSIKLS